tara:strand:- start:763 stop:2397 length:1635 start_codon:yes stop_codon:yes gene_type:complete
MATYYVSATTGADINNGLTVDGAKATIGAAENLATSAGDIVYIAPGTYREHVVHGYSGTAANRIYFIGDPDCEIFGNAVEPGIVRITITGADGLVEDEGTAYAVSSNGRDYITWKNVSLDGGSAAVSSYSYSTDGNITYGFRCAADSDYMEVINCITQTFYYGAYRVAYMYDSVFMGTVYSTRDGIEANRCIALAGYTGFYSITNVYNCISVGCASYGYLYNNWVQNCTAIGSANAFRTTNNDYVMDSHAIAAGTAFYGGTSATAASSNGMMSSSFASTCRYITRYGKLDGIGMDSCQYQWNTNQDPQTGLQGSTNMQGEGLLWEFRPPTLFNINKMKLFGEAIVPISSLGCQGSTTTDRDSTAPYTTDFDFLGNPRIMGEPKHMLLSGVTGLATSSRDIGAIELSQVEVTSSVSSSEPGFSIIDEGIFRIPVAVSGSSSITASIGVKHNKGAGTAVKPKIELRFAAAPVTASVTSRYTSNAAHTFLSGSLLSINSVTSTAANNVFETITVSGSFDKSCELELLFINQQTGSDSISTFSDLEIT